MSELVLEVSSYFRFLLEEINDSCDGHDVLSEVTCHIISLKHFNNPTK